MKHTTQKEINELKDIIVGRRRRVQGLTKMLKQGVSVKDYVWIKAEIAEHEKFLKESERIIKKFYAPAVA